MLAARQRMLTNRKRQHGSKQQTANFFDITLVHLQLVACTPGTCGNVDNAEAIFYSSLYVSKSKVIV